jgi:YidC/Oxa1 family membrane protein insertase
LGYAGIEDTYFAAAFLPPQGATPADLAIRYWKLERDVLVEGKPAKEPVPEVAVRRPDSGALALRVYVGPKDYDELKKMDPPLHSLVQFGEWLGLMAEPLFYLLKWLHRYVPNWGWAIVALTLAINMLLFPLKVKSYRSMQRMQKVAPEVKQIQERYKKYSMRDPRKAEMNKEIMAIYSREGINPVGGCLPMVLQMPVWLGLYRMLGVTIELRHAPWIFWVRDLSAKDPTYILVIIMALTMYWMQKMTPVTTTDPTQQKMFKLMPVMFAGMFVVYPVSSGLVLYILTQNVVGMLQQWYLNRTHPAPGSAKIQRGKKK